MNLLRRYKHALILFGFSIAYLGYAEPVAVRHVQGTNHGFLAVHTQDGKLIARGELTQVVEGDRVISHLVYRFLDGSIDDETTIFTQHNTFELISNHHIQRGPSFPEPIDFLFESGKARNRSQDKNGKEKIESVAIEAPRDTYNGLTLTALTNLEPTLPETQIAFIAPTAKPRLVHVSIKHVGETGFSAGGLHHKAIEFVLHVEIGGIAGAVAPIVGKQPADIHVWILRGLAPTFLREEGPFYVGGPIWRVDQVAPSLPR
jgi:hypothetical protein